MSQSRQRPLMKSARKLLVALVALPLIGCVESSDSLCLARTIRLDEKEIGALREATAQDLLFNNLLLRRTCKGEGR